MQRFESVGLRKVEYGRAPVLIGLKGQFPDHVMRILPRNDVRQLRKQLFFDAQIEFHFNDLLLAFDDMLDFFVFDDFALVDDDHAVANRLDFLHDVRRQKNSFVLSGIFDHRADLDQLVRIESCGGLIEDQYIGVVQQRIGQPDALAVPFGQLPDFFVGLGRESRQGDDFIDPRGSYFVHIGVETQVFAHIQIEIQRIVFGQIPDGLLYRFWIFGHIESVYGRRSFVCAEVGGQDFHQRRFARAVRAQKTNDFAFFDRKRYVIERFLAAVMLGNLADCYGHIKGFPANVIQKNKAGARFLFRLTMLSYISNLKPMTMKNWIWLLAVSTPMVAQIPAIDHSEVVRIENVLAADDMEGRRVFTPGIDKASAFIEGEFAKIGLAQFGHLTGYRQEFTVRGKQANNVVGFLPGKSKPDEFVIFSAHFDHLGLAESGEDKVYNGANDDASGVTAVIALAQYFTQKANNERSVLFVLFTAEEVGGFGSAHFAKQINPDQVSAMFNIEMIGTQSHWGVDSAYITGFEKSDFGPILQQNLADSPFRFYPDPYPAEQLFYRSDNAQLAKLGVPAHTISTSKMDAEPNYHRASDEVSTLDLENMTRVIRAIALSATGIISGQQTPTRVAK